MSSRRSRIQRVIKTFREACALVETGFEYVYGFNGAKLF